jgi:hypothetical protein
MPPANESTKALEAILIFKGRLFRWFGRFAPLRSSFLFKLADPHNRYLWMIPYNRIQARRKKWFATA